MTTDTYYYTTEEADNLDKRASNFFRSNTNALTRCEQQNAKAVEMGLKARYTVSTFEGAVESKDARD